MFWKNNRKKNVEEEYLFDFKEMIFVGERILKDYLLRGKLRDYSESFIVVCDKDMAGNELSYNLSLGKIGKIVQHQKLGEHSRGLRFDDFSNPFDNLLEKSQWFARINYREPISIVSEGKIIYTLKMPHQTKGQTIDGFKAHYSNIGGIYGGGPFEADKLRDDRILISSVDSKRLDEMICEVYSNRIKEYHR